MDVKEVKLYIYENNKLEEVLNALGMHNIKWHDNNSYITCGMPDGDNKSSTTIYNNFTLNVVAYTRDIKDAYGASDIISLICFIKKLYFSHAVGWLCNLVGLEYYHKQKTQDKILQHLFSINSIIKKTTYEEPSLYPLDEIHLRPYTRMSFQQFVDDGITDETQNEFELAIDLQTDFYGKPRHRIAIPIRDEFGTLVGVKGRLTKNTFFNGKCIDEERKENEPKYIYMHECAKSQILFGLYKTAKHIIEKKEVIICESEKGVMQLWSYGFKNAVGIGGHKLSNAQKEKIIRLGVSVVFAFDKDILENEILEECKGISHICNNVRYIYDKNNILLEKESPMDNKEKWIELYEKNKYICT